MKKLVLPLLLAIATLSSCTKRGPAGQDGLDGLNANVEAFEYEILPSAWAEAGTIGTSDYGFYALAAFPEITNDILVNGSVAGFYLIDDGGQIPMPSIFYNDQGFQTNYDFILYPGEIEFWVRESDNQTVAPDVAKYYKMVVISGNYKSAPNLKDMTLEEIEAQYNITEYKKVSINKFVY